MTQKIGKVFCSYASANLDEVFHFDLALRRRGVPLWRDRTSLGKGTLSAEEIDQAAKEAVGFTFYLTSEAAQSEWVRERERSVALQNARLDSSFGVVPIFRHDRKEVTKQMVALGAVPASPGAASPYDLSPFNGYLMNQSAFADKTEHTEFASAADCVLRSLLRSKMKQSGSDAALRIGAVTRSGPLVLNSPLDLLVDWTNDFPPSALRYPNGNISANVLLQSLASLGRAISEEWTPHRGARFQLVPQCHLSLALALGFQFRRNTGAELDVIEPQSCAHWAGPRVPLPFANNLWQVSRRSRKGAGLAVVFGISRSALKDVEETVQAYSLDIGNFLNFEPQNGCSPNVIQSGNPELAHQMAVSAVQSVSEIQSGVGCRTIHLFLAGPAAFGVLLGQQLSNLGPVQCYEWSVSDRHYVPTVLLH